jgi:hypothetical protein
MQSGGGKNCPFPLHQAPAVDRSGISRPKGTTMSISGISSPDGPLQLQDNDLAQRRRDFFALSNALRNGDLSAAQGAYADLQQLQSNGTAGRQIGSTANPVSADFAALGKALESNDLAGAQSAFAKLQSDLRTGHAGHRHHRGAGGAPGDLTANGSTGAPSGSNSSNDPDGDGDNDSSGVSGINLTA